jgi:site-specific DNA-methyltransferase (adenine-specific)
MQIVRQADACDLSFLSSKSVDLVLGSPPYCDARTYGINAQRKLQQWVGWMVQVTLEALRVSRGPVVWVVNGVVRKGEYWPAAEELLCAVRSAGGYLERPLIWHKNSPPNRKDWWVNDWEFVVCIKHEPGSVPYFDWRSVAKPPKYKAGGAFRQRQRNGRRNRGNNYPQNALARPRDVLRACVGGGQMGSKLAHENEAPFPESLIEQILPVLCPPQGTVLDPFCGSGTTAAVAKRLGRGYVACDLRESQVELTKRRLKEVKTTKTGHGTAHDDFIDAIIDPSGY